MGRPRWDFSNVGGADPTCCGRVGGGEIGGWLFAGVACGMTKAGRAGLSNQNVIYRGSVLRAGRPSTPQATPPPPGGHPSLCVCACVK